MDIIDRLKKEKKTGSVFDALEKKRKEEKKKEGAQEIPVDIEVRELKTESPSVPREPVIEQKAPQAKEFHTEGMHEFDMESLSLSSSANLKIEYKSRVSKLIDEDKIDEAIRVLLELKNKISEKKE